MRVGLALCVPCVASPSSFMGGCTGDPGPVSHACVHSHTPDSLDYDDSWVFMNSLDYAHCTAGMLSALYCLFFLKVWLFCADKWNTDAKHRHRPPKI